MFIFLKNTLDCIKEDKISYFTKVWLLLLRPWQTLDSRILQSLLTEDNSVLSRKTFNLAQFTWFRDKRPQSYNEKDLVNERQEAFTQSKLPSYFVNHHYCFYTIIFNAYLKKLANSNILYYF